jgi:hypothetical protein
MTDLLIIPIVLVIVIALIGWSNGNGRDTTNTGGY